jgi:hypothetical protein
VTSAPDAPEGMRVAAVTVKSLSPASGATCTDGDAVVAQIVAWPLEPAPVGDPRHAWLHAADRFDTLGLRGNDLRRLTFRDVRVPAENVLGEPADGLRIAMHTLNNGRTSLGTGIVGATKRLIELAITHTNAREQFGRPLAEFELVEDKISWIVSYLARGPDGPRLVPTATVPSCSDGGPATVGSPVPATVRPVSPDRAPSPVPKPLRASEGRRNTTASWWNQNVATLTSFSCALSGSVAVFQLVVPAACSADLTAEGEAVGWVAL